MNKLVLMLLMSAFSGVAMNAWGMEESGKADTLDELYAPILKKFEGELNRVLNGSLVGGEKSDMVVSIWGRSIDARLAVRKEFLKRDDLTLEQRVNALDVEGVGRMLEGGKLSHEEIQKALNSIPRGTMDETRTTLVELLKTALNK